MVTILNCLYCFVIDITCICRSVDRKRHQSGLSTSSATSPAPSRHFSGSSPLPGHGYSDSSPLPLSGKDDNGDSQIRGTSHRVIHKRRNFSILQESELKGLKQPSTHYFVCCCVNLQIQIKVWTRMYNSLGKST